MESYTHFADYYDLLMEDTDYGLWADYIENLFQRRGKAVRTIVELACGTGNMTCLLAERGYECIGIDRSEAMLIRAKEKAFSQGVNISFLLQDMSRMDYVKPADAVLCLCDGINYLTRKKDVMGLFERTAKIIGPEGIFIFDISSEYKLSTVLGNNIFAENRPEVSYIWENSYDRRKRLVEMILTIFGREGEIYRKYEEVHLQAAYLEEELLEMLSEAGFGKVEVFETFTFDTPVRESERITFVCELQGGKE